MELKFSVLLKKFKIINSLWNGVDLYRFKVRMFIL